LPGPGGRSADRRLDRPGRAVAGDGGVAAGVPVHAASPVHHCAAPAGSGPVRWIGHGPGGGRWRGHRPGSMIEAPDLGAPEMSRSTVAPEAATGMLPIPPALFALAATGQRLLSRRKRAKDEESGRRGSGADHGRPRRRRCSGGRRVLSAGVAGASVALLVAGASDMAEAGTSLDART